MTAIALVARYAIAESVRRRVFVIVLLLTTVFLGLFALGVNEAFEELAEFEAEGDFGEIPVDERRLAGATLLGLSMFATLFLGAVLGAFLTLSAIRGDAERGLLQPLVVRPLGRESLLAGRFLAAAAVCAVYAIAVFGGATLIVGSIGEWWPDQFVVPALELAAAVVVITALSLLGSVFLSATANGIGVFMLFGAGLVAGLLGQIGEGLNSPTLIDVGRRTSWALPFEALYQDGLARISSESLGLTGFVLQLGPFGGAQDAGAALVPWTLAYLGVVALVAVVAFRRRDL